VLHIRPWEIGRLTVSEFLLLCDSLDDYNRPDQEE
jgi:hypothetical protein